MTEYSKITNKQKKLIKSLGTKAGREGSGLFLVEGSKMCAELLDSDSNTQLIVIHSNSDSTNRKIADGFAKKNIGVLIDTADSFFKISDSKSPQGILAVVEKKIDKPIIDKPFIALDGISDPGNMGTIIRTAEWFGFEQLILGEDCADKYNPKVVRATMGSIFRLKIIHTNDLNNYIKEYFPNHSIYGAVLEFCIQLDSCKPDNNFGIILGNESKGIRKNILDTIEFRFKIPGYGKNESLNVAVAGGIAMHHFAKHINIQKVK